MTVAKVYPYRTLWPVCSLWPVVLGEAPMLTTDPQILNDQFAIAQHITFAATAGGLPVAQIHNAYAAASVAVQGGHVIAFQPHGQQPVLWVSSLSAFEP